MPLDVSRMFNVVHSDQPLFALFIWSPLDATNDLHRTNVVFVTYKKCKVISFFLMVIIWKFVQIWE